MKSSGTIASLLSTAATYTLNLLGGLEIYCLQKQFYEALGRIGDEWQQFVPKRQDGFLKNNEALQEKNNKIGDEKEHDHTSMFTK